MHQRSGIKQVVKSDLQDRYSNPDFLSLLLNEATLLSFLSEGRKNVNISVEEKVTQMAPTSSETEIWGPSGKSSGKS